MKKDRLIIRNNKYNIIDKGFIKKLETMIRIKGLKMNKLMLSKKYKNRK